MFLKFDQLNVVAILVAGLATLFLGGMWYMPIFGNLWLQLHGYSEEKVKEMHARVPPVLFFGGMILCYLVSAVVVALLVIHLELDPTTPLDGLVLGTGLGVLVSAIAFTAHLASDKHFGIFAIDAGFYFLLLNVQSVLLNWWR
jgi:hypothetical protein